MSKSRIIVITGVTRGLGRAMAITFASLGHTVIGCGRSQAAIDVLKTELGKPHRFDVVDVTVTMTWRYGQYRSPDLDH